MAVAARDPFGNFALLHSFTQGSESRFINIEGGLAGEAHQLNFVITFSRAATVRDFIRADAFQRRRRVAQAVEENVHRSFFHTDTAGANSTFREPFCSKLVGAFVFLPDAHFDGPAKIFAEARFLEP